VIVRQKLVTLIRLIQLGEGPYLRLLQVSSLERIKEKFGFGPKADVQQQEGHAPMIRFTLGEIEIGELRTVTISRLVIEPRKVILEVEGSSDEAETVYETLVDTLVQLTGVETKIFENPLLKTDESVIVAEMSFPAEALFVPELYEAITTTVAKEGGFESAKAHAMPATMAFEVEYLPTDMTMIERRIGLSRKELSIRPKPGYELSEQVYESKAPLPTAVHLRLLDMIESRLT
jgi:hypothetical protein